MERTPGTQPGWSAKGDPVTAGQTQKTSKDKDAGERPTGIETPNKTIRGIKIPEPKTPDVTDFVEYLIPSILYWMVNCKST